MTNPISMTVHSGLVAMLASLGVNAPGASSDAPEECATAHLAVLEMSFSSATVIAPS
uniref:Secreted protein n=1 Tax=Ascaris lumbricoides TaxID=6252 RepID=A0A0M3I8U2_ASCLU